MITSFRIDRNLKSKLTDEELADLQELLDENKNTKMTIDKLINCLKEICSSPIIQSINSENSSDDSSNSSSSGSEEEEEEEEESSSNSSSD